MKHMIKKTMLTGALSCFLLGTALADDATNQPAKPYWQDIQVVAVNKEAPRSSFMSYGDRATALSSRYEKSPFYSLLNGTWKFYFVDSYKDLPANITDPSVSTSDWDDITETGRYKDTVLPSTRITDMSSNHVTRNLRCCRKQTR